MLYNKWQLYQRQNRSQFWLCFTLYDRKTFLCLQKFVISSCNAHQLIVNSLLSQIIHTNFAADVWHNSTCDLCVNFRSFGLHAFKFPPNTIHSTCGYLNHLRWFQCSLFVQWYSVAQRLKVRLLNIFILLKVQHVVSNKRHKNLAQAKNAFHWKVENLPLLD